MARLLASNAFTQYVELSSRYEGGNHWFAAQQVVAVFEEGHIGLHRLVDGRHVEDAEQFALTSAEMAALVEAYSAFVTTRETVDGQAGDGLGELDAHPF